MVTEQPSRTATELPPTPATAPPRAASNPSPRTPSGFGHGPQDPVEPHGVRSHTDLTQHIRAAVAAYNRTLEAVKADRPMTEQPEAES